MKEFYVVWGYIELVGAWFYNLCEFMCSVDLLSPGDTNSLQLSTTPLSHIHPTLHLQWSQIIGMGMCHIDVAFQAEYSYESRFLLSWHIGSILCLQFSKFLDAPHFYLYKDGFKNMNKHEAFQDPSELWGSITVTHGCSGTTEPIVLTPNPFYMYLIMRQSDYDDKASHELRNQLHVLLR